ncbi:Transposase IS4 [Popillia japonica]|uniref:Transposase IS4 n=1 Tax=Popillia japonica TaxID=7064 RepID=A0AAW1IE54_POPJA
MSRGESVRSVAVKYSIGKSTVSDICKNKANIMDYVAEDHNLDKRKTLRLSAYPAMEKALYTWFVQERARGKMNKNIIDLENPNDIEEIHRLLYDDDDFGEEDFNGSDDSETEDCVEMRDLMSDTDHEVENSENEGNLELDNTHFFYGKNGTQWRKQPWKKTHSRPQNIMRVLRGVIQAARKSKTEIECWKLFFSDDILDLIVANTNNYIQIVKDKLHRERDSRPTDITEMKACFGLLYLAGVFRGGRQNLDDMWATDDLGINMFRMAMSEKRFRFLIRFSETEQDTHSQNLGGTIKNPKAVEESLEKTLTDMVNNVRLQLQNEIQSVLQPTNQYGTNGPRNTFNPSNNTFPSNRPAYFPGQTTRHRLPNSRTTDGRPICFRCHRPGHTAAACRTGISQQNNSGNNRGRE